MKTNQLYTTIITTPFGNLRAIADNDKLYSLSFNLDIPAQCQAHNQTPITSSTTALFEQLTQELHAYNNGTLKQFTVPLNISGTPFQQRVWQELQKIPYGQTRSYKEVAQALGKPTAFRAAALANGANRFSVIIPCHRVINTNGKLGGYNGGVSIKQMLLQHEQSYQKKSVSL